MNLKTDKKYERFRINRSKSKIDAKCVFVVWWMIFAYFFVVATFAAILDEELQQQQQQQQKTPTQDAIFFDYRCADNALPENPARESVLNLPQMAIGLQVSDHATHQLLTRIFAIFMREKLKYRNISLIPLKVKSNPNHTDFEMQKLTDILNLIRYHPKLPDMKMVNLEVWMPPNGHNFIPLNVYAAGQSIAAGRFGWFTPKDLNNANNVGLDSLHYKIFLDQTNINYQRYLIDQDFLNSIRNNDDVVRFDSPLCDQSLCVTLLAEYRVDSVFIEQQIIETGSYLNVLWLGAHFRETVQRLHELYQQSDTYATKSFIILHWTPSEVIDGAIKFQQMTMPRCEDLNSLNNSLCKYELTPILKYFSKSLGTSANLRLIHALRRFNINNAALEDLLIDLYERLRKGHNDATKDELYNEVACNWFRNNEQLSKAWISEEPEITLLIGGIFPINETNRGHHNLISASSLAVSAINRNRTVLKNYKLDVHVNDGQCKADLVMKSFIHYFSEQYLLGVLGPACSETVEPIAGISKHTNMAVISYSAEGASFVDRQTYPFFFRTIGSNRQYEDAYISLMQRLGWRRVAALTEDGQKYTEYISHMEATMKKHNLELIINKKFQSDVTAAVMRKHLGDLKRKHAKIIIADIHNRNAELALCEALKLGMTAYEGYVWFLPSWLSKDWSASAIRSNESCSSESLQKAFEGHFSIMHTPFGEPTALMQENITIKAWLDAYKAKNVNISNYIGFTYDAVWAYALAADKLLSENKDSINILRSEIVVKRFVELIWQTDFEGLSGRVRFGQGGSRITELKIMQWRDGQFVEVGNFLPELVGKGSKLRTNGGRLEIASIEWLSSVKPPGDGTYDCNFSALAEFMDTDCDNAAVIFTALLCFLALVVVSFVSFFFWKQRYDSKLKVSVKIMKNFGIDLLSPSRSKLNTLDKWEVPKENVVINRRLGEGAFGTVYGGEAQLNAETCWTAVAVKTLKAGASTEDRLDFLSEAEAMKRFTHKNIVKLLGVCLQTEPIYTIMEFMLYGDLKTYLLARRHLVNESISDESDISAKRLTICAMDVARGLSYLAQQKYVHRDIACRNLLVNAQRVVKLGDFGMARPTFESDYYRFNRKGMLPVRWMAPESLALGLFTPASDVWAFGVVLYEIVTFGSFPYQGLTNNQVLEYVKSGKTLQIPTGVKPHLVALIKACWSHDVKKRPTATEIVDYISNYSRLLTPCLDIPGASVEMPESESDQLELLPKLRKPSPNRQDSTVDILLATNALRNVDDDASSEYIDYLEMPEHTHIDMQNENENSAPSSNNTDTFSPITPEGYSIMSPLIHQNSESSDSSQSRLLQISAPPDSSLQQTPF